MLRVRLGSLIGTTAMQAHRSTSTSHVHLVAILHCPHTWTCFPSFWHVLASQPGPPTMEDHRMLTAVDSSLCLQTMQAPPRGRPGRSWGYLRKLLRYARACSAWTCAVLFALMVRRRALHGAQGATVQSALFVFVVDHTLVHSAGSAHNSNMGAGNLEWLLFLSYRLCCLNLCCAWHLFSPICQMHLHHLTAQCLSSCPTVLTLVSLCVAALVPDLSPYASHAARAGCCVLASCVI